MTSLSRIGSFLTVGAIAALAFVAVRPVVQSAIADEAPRVVAAPALDNPHAAGPLQTAVIAGGCFWGMQGVFEHVKGVHQVWAGYSGGEAATAHYEMVGTETTGHAESIKIVFDPKVVSFGEILRIYFSVAHDPTELNRQGPDSGTSYRSEIFAADAQQAKIANAYIVQLNGAHAFSAPIVTKVEALKGFYPAEGYHQDYLIHNPDQPYIAFNDLPKVRNLARLFPAMYSDKPVMVTPAS